MESIVEFKTSSEGFDTEYEIISPVNISEIGDIRERQMAKKILDVDEKLALIEDKIAELNTDIGRLTNHADGIDYTIAVSSGIVSGIVDSIFVVFRKSK